MDTTIYLYWNIQHFWRKNLSISNASPGAVHLEGLAEFCSAFVALLHADLGHEPSSQPVFDGKNAEFFAKS